MAAVLFTTKTYHCPTADIQFDYPSEWQPDAATTSLFTVTAPTTSHCCLNLDVPTLPWHPRGMITVNMVADGYERDLKKNQIHDAVQEEACSVSVPDAQAKRITTCGHENGKTLIDMAVILIHADRVYILSTDTDDQGDDYNYQSDSTNLAETTLGLVRGSRSVYVLGRLFTHGPGLYG